MTQTLTQPQALSVEYQELMTRADEVEAAIPGQPAENPGAPCALAMVTAAAAQLALSADNMRLYLGVGDRERRRLAESLRNAAKAYEEVDESAEEAIDNGTSVSPATPGLADEGPDPVTLSDTKRLRRRLKRRLITRSGRPPRRSPRLIRASRSICSRRRGPFTNGRCLKPAIDSGRSSIGMATPRMPLKTTSIRTGRGWTRWRRCPARWSARRKASCQRTAGR